MAFYDTSMQIVNFLSRSRSRSRSRKRRSRSLDAYPVDPMPATVHTASLRVHARHSSFDHERDANIAGPSRPTTRIPSRPLSNTTIATNATAKPRPKKAPESIVVPVAGPAPVATAGLVAQVVPIDRSNSSRKGKRINIFGILLPSPRKGSFSESSRGRSRPTTPSPATNTSDQASNGRDDRPLAEKSGSQRSTKSARKGLPVHADELASGCLRSSESGRSALPDLVSSQPRRVPVHVLNSPRRGEFLEDDPDADLISLEGRCSPLCGFGTGTSSKGSYTSMDKGKEKERRHSSRDRSAERTRESRKEKEREREREKEKERITHPRRVGSPLPRARQSASAVAVAAVPMEKSSSGQSGNSRRSGSKEYRGGGAPPRSGAEAGVAVRAKRIKHGSFDFERPVSAGSGAAPAGGGISIKAALRNMGIGETERHSALQRSRSERAGPRRPTDDSVEDGSAPSSVPSKRTALDKGKKPAMDVHFAEPPSHRTLDRSTSTGHQSQPTSHSSHSHPRSRGHASSHQPAHSNSTSSHGYRRDAVPASPMSTASGEASGESSGHNRDGSWGRSAGKRVGRASHGPFRFEPAVPPIPGSPADTERRPAPRNVPRPTSPSPFSSSDPMSRSQQARLAGKGRSLDLGLGLTWAPSKVREEAVLRVGGPRTGISSTTSSAARARSRWRGADEEGRLIAGAASDVAHAFKEALGDSAYGIFKNCQYMVFI